jgi:uncharacterized YccA/Bax inhibitor family protein
MESRNPVFARSEAFSAGAAGVDAATVQQLEQAYAAPSAGPLATQRMTHTDVVVKTGITFAVLVPFALLSYSLTQGGNASLVWIGMLGGLILGLVNAFKREPSPPLILLYAAFEGLFLGGISFLFEAYAGAAAGTLVIQAVVATFAVFAVMLVSYRSGWIRATPKFRRMLIVGMLGYAGALLLSFVLSLFTSVPYLWSLDNGWLGVAVGLFAVALAAMSLVLDFDMADQLVAQGAPEKYSWTVAFGLVVTLVWLYLEILRLLAILNSD